MVAVTNQPTISQIEKNLKEHFLYKKTNLDTLKDPFFELKQVTDDLKIQNTTVTPLDDAFYIQVLPNPLKVSQLIKEEPSKDSQLISEGALKRPEIITVQVVNRHIKQYIKK